MGYLEFSCIFRAYVDLFDFNVATLEDFFKLKVSPFCRKF